MIKEKNLVIDGSLGEGGGQILRTSISLAAILGKTVEIQNIRSKRKNPGLNFQHLHSVKTISKLCNGEVLNAYLGSQSIKFKPNKLIERDLEVDIGTAGSITLFLQAIIPTVALSNIDLKITIKGGTDVKWSPTINYLQEVYRPIYRILGIEFDVKLIRRGYYPKGNGKVEVIIKKSSKIRSIKLTNRNIREVNLFISSYNENIINKIKKTIITKLIENNVAVDNTETEITTSMSPGCTMLLYSVNNNNTFIGSDNVNNKNINEYEIGTKCAETFLREVKSYSSIDKNLADMIILPLSLADNKSEFITSNITEHLRTNLEINKLFTSCKYNIQEESSIVTLYPNNQS